MTNLKTAVVRLLDTIVSNMSLLPAIVTDVLCVCRLAVEEVHLLSFSMANNMCRFKLAFLFHISKTPHIFSLSLSSIHSPFSLTSNEEIPRIGSRDRWRILFFTVSLPIFGNPTRSFVIHRRKKKNDFGKSALSFSLSLSLSLIHTLLLKTFSSFSDFESYSESLQRHCIWGQGTLHVAVQPYPHMVCLCACMCVGGGAGVGVVLYVIARMCANFTLM